MKTWNDLNKFQKSQNYFTRLGQISHNHNIFYYSSPILFITQTCELHGNVIPSHPHATKQLPSAVTTAQSQLLMKVNFVVFRRVLSFLHFSLTFSVQGGGGFMVEAY